MIALLSILAIALVLSFVPVLLIFFKARRRFAGIRRVPCPRTGRPALIRLDATHAAATSLRGEPEMKVQSCNRWAGPVGDCEEECVREAEPSILERSQAG